ncbi:MAG TPA: LemA family protein [Armatimonadota bacterium]|nr:LemA family protein [Armatimonadota bacterium]
MTVAALGTVLVAVIIGLVIIIGLWYMLTYNRLVALREQFRNAWSQIDVQLKRRHDLIPNLVETVKGYAAHERQTLEAVIKARQMAVDAKNIQETQQAENALTSTLRSLFAVAESYPDLKANQNFMMLQEELSGTEGKIAYARQHYNDVVNMYNATIKSFPANIIANSSGFTEQPYFEIETGEREVPTVKF